MLFIICENYCNMFPFTFKVKELQHNDYESKHWHNKQDYTYITHQHIDNDCCNSEYPFHGQHYICIPVQLYTNNTCNNT